MHEIICPHCSKAFKIDEAGYADILKQVRGGAFEQQLHERLELAEQDKRNAVELAQAKAAGEMQKSAVAKDSEIQELKARLDAAEVARKLAVTEALSAVQKERDALANELQQAKRDMKARLSTKMVGETLEQHCEPKFNRIRATACPPAYFEKGNGARTGSRGDMKPFCPASCKSMEMSYA